MKTIVLSAKSPIRQPSVQHGFPPSRSNGAAGLLIPLLLACFGLAPMVQAVGPDTDGSIAGANNGEGIGVLVSRTTGIWNTGTGFEALNHLTAGNQNTATGLRALFSDTSGGFNSATGVYSLFSNTSGFFNSATGAYSLAHNTIASYNTANGYSALYFNTEGEANTATGFAALYKNTTGIENVANGSQALYSNTTGSENTATGAFALFRNTTGHDNAATGQAALVNNTTGADNTANGVTALNHNTSGNNNIALGVIAGSNLTTGDNNIDIGNEGVAAEANTIRIGTVGTQTAAFIAGISGAVVPGGVTVVVDAGGHLGTVVSSQRFKDEIKPMDKESETILALKPVTFRYKKEIDPKSVPQFGLVAEEVAKVNPDLVARDAAGKINTVRYEAVNAMLLNEFLKEHKKVGQLEGMVASLAATVKEQAAQIEKVSAQIKAGKAVERIALNNP